MASNYKQKYLEYKKRLQSVRSLYQKPVIRTYSLLVFTFAAISILAFTAIKPTVKTIAGLVKEIKDKRVASGKLTKKIESLSEAQIAYRRIENQLDNLEKAVPKRPNFANLVWEVEYLAFQNNIELTSLQIGKVVLLEEDLEKENTSQNPKGTPVKISLSLTIQGKYSDIKSFSNQLENLKRIIQVNKIHFSSEKVRQEEVLKFSLKAEAFYLMEGKFDKS
jgi:Tfp pilus assembly protein PilO